MPTPSRSTYVFSGVGKIGSLALLNNTPLANGIAFGAASVSLNLTTEGTYDWGVSTAVAASIAQITYDPALFRWKRSRGGVLVPPNVCFEGNADVTFGGLGSGPIQTSANAGDDIGGFTAGNFASYPLTNNRSSLGLFQNNTSVVPTGYGFKARIPLVAGQLRTINFYVFVRSQVNKTATGTFTAHLMDGTAADVSTTVLSISGSGGATYFFNRITIQVRAGISCDLICNFLLTSTTGITTVTGDAIGIQAITMA